MINIIISIAFLIAVYLFYRKEKISTYIITPIISLGLPYGMIMVVTNIIGIINSEKTSKISIWVPIYSCIYICVFGVVGGVIKKVIIQRRYIENKKCSHITAHRIFCELKYEKLYDILLVIMLVIIATLYIINFGINVPNLSNIKLVFSNGIQAHIMNVTSMFMLIRYTTKKNKNKKCLIAIFWAAFLMIASTKYIMFMYSISILFIYVFFNKKKFSLKKIAVISLILSSLFLLVYIARFLSEGYKLNEIPYEFIIEHYLHYMNGSFYAFSEILQHNISGNIGFGIILSPLINVINIILGNPLIGTISEFIPIYSIKGYSSTNVFTMFGVFQYEVGFFGAFLLIMLVAILIYICYYKMLIKKNIIILVAGIYLCSTLFFAFFNSFYGTINVWESLIVLYIIYIIEKIKIR